MYGVREKAALRTDEGLMQRSADGKRAFRRRPPVRVDCGYCITSFRRASAESVLDEHRLLTQVLTVLLKNPTIPAHVLQRGLAGQVPPYPTVIALPDRVKSAADFWRAPEQHFQPSMNYVMTRA